MTLDAVLGALVREAVRVELAPVVAELRALAGEPSPSPWMSADAAARYAGCNARILRAAAVSGALVAARVGRRGWRIRPADVDDWLARNAGDERAQQPDQQPSARGSRPESPDPVPVCGPSCESRPATPYPMNGTRA